MGKVEIKIRKKILTPDNLQQYRDYPALLKKYERNKRFKRALRIFIYSLALTLFVLALIFLGMWKVLMDKEEEINPSTIHTYLRFDATGVRDTVDFKIINVNVTDTFYILTFQVDTFKSVIKNKLPLQSSYNRAGYEFHYVDEKFISVDGKDYKTVKYLFDISGIDDENFVFFSPEFGILNTHAWWGSRYSRLIKTGNVKNDQIIWRLTEAIEGDKDFFTGRNR